LTPAPFQAGVKLIQALGLVAIDNFGVTLGRREPINTAVAQRLGEPTGIVPTISSSSMIIYWAN